MSSHFLLVQPPCLKHPHCSFTFVPRCALEHITEQPNCHGRKTGSYCRRIEIPISIVLFNDAIVLKYLTLPRLSRYQQFKDFQKRILVATNLFGRGMDIERVNIVFNYDMPEDSDTYLHRVSRTCK